jgi:chemotaxis family two-component system sensor kinase Cph1
MDTDMDAATFMFLAGETDRMLGRSIGTTLDHTLGDVLGSQAAALVASAQAASEPVYLGSVAIAGAELCLTAHDRDGVRILEIEPSSPLPQSTAEVMARARETAARFARARTHAELLQRAVREARRLTGFDRVMAYRFLGDGSGSVVAEDRADALPAFLNHRYPASDIPRQARELYLRNAIRVIPNVSYAPAPLVPTLNPVTGTPLDMSECTLRSVSPIHVQYL